MQSGAPKFIEASSLAWEAALLSGGSPAQEQVLEVPASLEALVSLPPAVEIEPGTESFATTAALIFTAGNETEAEQVTDAAAQAFLNGQPEAAIALAQVGWLWVQSGHPAHAWDVHSNLSPRLLYAGCCCYNGFWAQPRH